MPLNLFHFFIIDAMENQTREFVTGKPFQSGLIFAGKARSLPLRRVTVKSYAQVGSGITQK
jgi:hypothetical protein